MVNVLIDAVAIRGSEGGGATHLGKILGEFDRQCDDMQSFVLTGPQFSVLTGPERWESLRRLSRVHWITCGRKVVTSVFARWRFYRRQIIRFVRQYDIDIYYAVTGFLPKGIGSLAATVSCPQNLLPFDHTERSKYSRTGFEYWRLWLLERRYVSSMRRSDLVIAISDYARKVYSRYIPDISERSHLIYHGVNSPFDRTGPASDLVEGEYILYVSNLTFYKYQIELLRAFDILGKDDRFTTKLVLAGWDNPHYLRRFHRELERLKLADRVIWLGTVKWEDLPGLYRGARLCVYCSGVECCPNILLEMMRSGCPMAISNRGPMPEIARDGAVYFDPGNPADIARGISEIYYDSVKASRLADQAYALSKQFTWQATAAKTIDAIRDAYHAGQQRLSEKRPDSR